MTLLREIQSAAIDSTVDISTVLRKAKVLAARLRNSEFASWVDLELNGYGEATLPPYRILQVYAFASIRDQFREWKAAPVMTSYLPEDLKRWGGEARLKQPIIEIASISSRSDGKHLIIQWPQELAVRYGAKGYNGFECVGAWQHIHPPALLGIVDTVRNRILEFVLRIEDENPDAGEAPPNTQPVPAERLQPLVNNITAVREMRFRFPSTV